MQKLPGFGAWQLLVILGEGGGREVKGCVL